MINCESCGKDNQKHYKFCLGCGTELHVHEKPDPTAMQTVAAESTNVIPKGVSTPQAPTNCTECGVEIPPKFKFCGACGHPVPVEAAAPVQEPSSAGTLTLIKPDGTEGGTFALTPGKNQIGRNHGELFVNDGYLSPDHCTIELGTDECVVSDNDSLNGVFYRMTEKEEISTGQFFRIGQELLRFDQFNPSTALDDDTEIMGSPNPGYWGKITVIVGDNMDGAAFPLAAEIFSLGRERGDINFPDDGYVSGLHAKVYAEEGLFFLEDLGSSNGTFRKITANRTLLAGSYVLLGQQLFKIDY